MEHYRKKLGEIANGVFQYFDLNNNPEKQHEAKIRFCQAHQLESQAWNRANDVDAFNDVFEAEVKRLDEIKAKAVADYIAAGGFVHDTSIFHSATDIDYRGVDNLIENHFGDEVQTDSDWDILRVFFPADRTDEIVEFLANLAFPIIVERTGDNADILKEEDIKIPGVEAWDDAERWLDQEGIELEQRDYSYIKPNRTDEEIDDLVDGALTLLRKTGLDDGVILATLKAKMS